MLPSDYRERFNPNQIVSSFDSTCCIVGIRTHAINYTTTHQQSLRMNWGDHTSFLPYRPLNSNKFPRSTSTGTLSRIWREEGIRGLYRGLGPTIFGYLPTWAIYFTAYDYYKELIARREGRDESDWVVHILAAMGAGATSTVLTNPFWVIKTRFMTQNEHTAYRYRNTANAFTTIARTEGLRGFYKGLGPSLMGVSHVAVQFPLYERLKVWMRWCGEWVKRGEGTNEWMVSQWRLFDACLISSWTMQPQTTVAWSSVMTRHRTPAKHTRFPPLIPSGPANGEDVTTLAILIASSISKMAASVATYPHEVIRTRLQNQTVAPHKYRGIVHAVKVMASEEGWTAFYKGMPTNLMRTVPASALTILTYELLVRKLSHTEETSRGEEG
ncbi:mitochondrial NAD transporter [Jimgerdemannia flammicorona]|uniref:Mitochondrial NAD transporter n=1 Tax=Jimgerdemannia flammicorona TaxID=994334 RepID=A0A433QMJ5_9FUNG|nr:mitochondrial NAD transporter [Jimgerdemannia flammicorona]